MLELLKNRRSTRKFTEKKIEKEKVDEILKAALLSPSSRNRRPWKVVAVEDKNLLKQLSEAKEHGSKLLEGAALGIVVAGDTSVTDVWIEDASIVSIIIQLEVESLGLGSCWVQIRNRKNSKGEDSSEYVKKLVGLPEQFSVESIIAIGYKDEQREPLTEEDMMWDKVDRI